MDLGASVRAEQLRTLFRQNRGVLWLNVAVSALVAAALWPTASRFLIVVWVLTTGLIALARTLLTLRYERALPTQSELEPWGGQFVAGSIAAGASWGVASVVFFDATNGPSELLFGFAIGGMTAAAAGTWSCHLPVFWGYFSSALAPFALRTLAVGDPTHVAMGGRRRTSRRRYLWILR